MKNNDMSDNPSACCYCGPLFQGQAAVCDTPGCQKEPPQNSPKLSKIKRTRELCGFLPLPIVGCLNIYIHTRLSHFCREQLAINIVNITEFPETAYTYTIHTHTHRPPFSNTRSGVYVYILRPPILVLSYLEN